MEQNVERDQRTNLAFWIAAALVAIGAVAPLAFTVGGHTRVGGVLVPFAFAAVAFGVNAVYHQGRSLAALLYFFAGLAIVYGILAMVAVPVRLAVLGTCPPAPALCPAGLEPPLTSGENSGLGLASFCGLLAIFIGFYGLVVLYRRRGPAARPWRSLWPAQAPGRPATTTAEVTPAKAAPAEAATALVSPAEVAPPEAAPAEVAPAASEVATEETAGAPPPAPTPAAEPPRAARPRSRPRVKPRVVAAEEPKELSAPDEPKELPAPAEPEELPPPA